MMKTISFTCMHFVIAFTVTYLLTGSIAIGGLVALVEPLCNSIGFYFHEKLWVCFERKKKRQLRGHHGFISTELDMLLLPANKYSR